jgi:hypothetical protein
MMLLKLAPFLTPASWILSLTPCKTSVRMPAMLVNKPS